MYRIRFFGLLFIICCIFTSCTREGKDLAASNQISIGSTYAAIYNNMFYYFDYNTRSIKYQDITNIKENGLKLINDPLISYDMDPFSNMFPGTFILVDYNATAKNDDMPVLVIAYRDEKISDGIPTGYYSIVSFNTKNSKITVIKDDIYDNIQSIHLYDNYIYYTVNRGDYGYDMCRVSINGRDFSTHKNADHELYRIQYIYNNKIFYVIEGTGELFSCNLDFSEDEYLFDVILKSDIFIYENYIYYYDNIQTKIYENFPVYFADLYRCPLNDYGACQKLISNVSVGMNYGNKYYYYESNPRLIGGTYYDDGTNILKVYNLDTQNSEEVYNYGENNEMTYYIALSKDYILLSSTNYDDMTKNMYAINITTKEKINFDN